MRRPETVTARKLRKDMSLPEALLWQRLKGQATGFKFRRQHPIGPYVIDFYCREAALVVEVDGEAHNRGGRPTLDINRDAFLNENGYIVIRIPAADVLRNVDSVADVIVAKALAASPLHHAPHGPPPRPGEDL